MKKFYLSLLTLLCSVGHSTPLAADEINNIVPSKESISATSEQQFVKTSKYTSPTWSGYSAMVDPSSLNKVSQVYAEWEIPQLSVNDINSGIFIFVGIEDTGVGVLSYSTPGLQQINLAGYLAETSSNHLPGTITLKAGDRISAEERNDGVNLTFILTNKSRNNQQVSITVPISTLRYSHKFQTAHWVVSDPTFLEGLPGQGVTPFETFSMSHCRATIGGHSGSINDKHWHHVGFPMITITGSPIVSVSDLKHHGEQFSLKFKARK